MPLSAKGLWLAEITAAGQSRLGREAATPGVGSTPVDDVGPFGGQPGGQGGLEHRARTGGCRGRRTKRPPGAEDAGRGPAEGQRQLRRQLDVGHAPDAVGAEAERHRRDRAALSAWSTAAPCGPS